MKIVVFAPNLIGDTVMATPTFRALRDGGADLDVVIRPHVAPTLDGSPWFDRVIPYSPKSDDPKRRTLAVVRRLRANRYDAAVLLPNSFRSALMARMAGIPRRVGYARGGRGMLLTDRLRPLRDRNGRFVPTPILPDYLALAHRLGFEASSTRIELFTTPDDEIAADRAFERLGLLGKRPLIVFNTGGAFGPAKSWPARHFGGLARRLVHEAGASILVVCGPSERDSARAIVAQSDHPRVVSLADEPLSIGLTKACVRRSDLMVTTDSGPRHFAGAFGVPVVTIFGPTHIAWTRTFLPNALHVQKDVPCGPCQRGECPLKHHECMNGLSPDPVFSASMRLLDGGGGRGGASVDPPSARDRPRIDPPTPTRSVTKPWAIHR